MTHFGYYTTADPVSQITLYTLVGEHTMSQLLDAFNEKVVAWPIQYAINPENEQ